MIDSNFQLTWQSQIKERKKPQLSSTTPKSSKVKDVGTKTIHRNSQGRNDVYHLKEVDGDGDCFFHAVARPTLTRDTLIGKLRESSKDQNVRQGFACEIRQFLYIGCTGKHEDQNENKAFKNLVIVAKKFRELIEILRKEEDDLRLQIIEIQKKYNEDINKGKTPQQLIDSLPESESGALSEIYNKIVKTDNQIKEFCSEQSIFERYVTEYLEKAKGYIPFSRKLEGENFDTTIDVISKLFKLNIQVFLEDGKRVTTKRTDHSVIPIFHDGINHFSGLAFTDPTVEMPLTISDISKKMVNPPDNFRRSHLLQSADSGICYQFLVLQDQMTDYLLRGISFKIRVEAEGYGNLDDLVISLKGEKGEKIEAFQIKYYCGPISAGLFVNAKPQVTKNAKMHIGKFFDGWLAHRSEKAQELESIIYTNTTLDQDLNDCVKDGKFSEEFITKKKVISIKKKDFYNNMSDQAEIYLKTLRTKEQKHLEVNFDEDLFQEFLRSFRFKTSQKDFEALKESIIHNLSQIAKERYGEIQTDQLYINLDKLVRDWFIHDNKTRSAPELTNDLLTECLNQAQTRFHDKVKLHTITNQTLLHIHGECQGIAIERPEEDMLKDALNSPGLVIVMGDKGMGKSGLVKNVLTRHDKRDYFFLPAQQLIQDEKSKNMVISVLKQERTRPTLVLDSAEKLLSLKDSERNAFLNSFLQTDCTLVLTLTPDAFNAFAVGSKKPFIIEVKMINEKTMLDKFAQLSPYQNIAPLMKLATIPFFLNIILELLSKGNLEDMNRIIKISDSKLELEFITQAVKGSDKKFSKVRKNAWMKLTSQIARGSVGVVDSENPLRGSEIVIDGTTLEPPQTGFTFSHDLFFEYGLIALWTKKWQLCELEDNTGSFWDNLPTYLKFNNPIPVLSKWFLLQRELVESDLLSHAKASSTKEVYKFLIAMAIVIEDTVLLSKLMTYQGQMKLSKDLNGVALAIKLNNPMALEALFKLSAPFELMEDSPKETDLSELWLDEFEPIAEESTCWTNPEELRKKFCHYTAKYWSEKYNFRTYSDNESLYFHQAIQQKHLDCLKTLLNQNDFIEYVNNSNGYGETPLHLSTLENDHDATYLLLEKNASVHEKDIWGETPLHNLAYIGDVKLAEQLLEKGADPNEVNAVGLTPLHIALARLDIEMVKCFLKYHGDLSIHPFNFEKFTIADLLDNSDPDLTDKMEKFVVALIAELNYGWKKDPSNASEDTNQKIVKDLMTLIDAQLSEHCPGFDYYDSKTELDYIVKQGLLEKLEDVAEYILDDPERIAQVLKSDIFSLLKKELVDNWIDIATNEQIENLKAYAEKYKDDEVNDLLQILDISSDFSVSVSKEDLARFFKEVSTIF